MEQDEIKQPELHIITKILCILCLMRLCVNVFLFIMKYINTSNITGSFYWGGLIWSEILTILNIALYSTVLFRSKVSLYLIPITVTLSVVFFFIPTVSANSLVNNLILCACLFIRKDGISGWNVLKEA